VGHILDPAPTSAPASAPTAAPEPAPAVKYFAVHICLFVRYWSV